MPLGLALTERNMIQMTTASGEHIFITLSKKSGKSARLLISAPQSVSIYRHEREERHPRPEPGRDRSRS